MFDVWLVQFLWVLLSLVDELFSDLSVFFGDFIVLCGWYGCVEGVGEVLVFKDGYVYENKLVFQIWMLEGCLFF